MRKQTTITVIGALRVKVSKYLGWIHSRWGPVFVMFTFLLRSCLQFFGGWIIIQNYQTGSLSVASGSFVVYVVNLVNLTLDMMVCVTMQVDMSLGGPNTIFTLEHFKIWIWWYATMQVDMFLGGPITIFTLGHFNLRIDGLGGSGGWPGRGFNPNWGWQHSFMEIEHEIFSTVILSLPLIQEGQLSVSGERISTILVNRLRGLSLPSKRLVR